MTDSAYKDVNSHILVNMKRIISFMGLLMFCYWTLLSNSPTVYKFSSPASSSSSSSSSSPSSSSSSSSSSLPSNQWLMNLKEWLHKDNDATLIPERLRYDNIIAKSRKRACKQDWLVCLWGCNGVDTYNYYLTTACRWVLRGGREATRQVIIVSHCRWGQIVCWTNPLQTASLSCTCHCCQQTTNPTALALPTWWCMLPSLCDQSTAAKLPEPHHTAFRKASYCTTDWKTCHSLS